jgi:hypothetical protein
MKADILETSGEVKQKLKSPSQRLLIIARARGCGPVFFRSPRHD